MNKKLLSSLLVAGMFMSQVAPVFAATQGSVLNIEAKATTVNMTVPGTAAIVFNADGTNTTPTNFNITNNSQIAGVHLESVDLNAGESGWKVVDASTDIKTQAVNTKNIRLKVGKEGQEQIVQPTSGNSNSTGKATLGQSLFSIAAEGTETMKFVVERGAFTTPEAEAKAFDMTLNFEFNS